MMEHGDAGPNRTAARRDDETYLRECLALARRGLGRTSPNPMVGAILVKAGRVIGRGYHDHPGAPHAEVMALRAAGTEAAGATLYVNLEPCCHFGKTPPCVEEIIRRRVREVFASIRDPDPRVDGRGFEALRQAGVRVRVGGLEEESRRLNESFHKFARTRRPFLVVKAALSLDGKLATGRGESRWISGRESRRRVQELRYQADGLMVGLETVRKDDPRLTLRGGSRPDKTLTRILVDSRLRTPVTARVLRTLSQGPILVYTTRSAPGPAARNLEAAGARVIPVASRGGRVFLPAVLEDLGDRDITSVLLEGGGELIGSAFRDGLVDKIILFLAPRIIGGRRAPGLFMGEGFESLDACPRIRDLRVARSGEDIVLEGYPETGVLRDGTGAGEAVGRPAGEIHPGSLARPEV